MNSICNIKYVSGITDIYEKYGELVNACGAESQLSSS
jgi:hypothetical protein